MKLKSILHGLLVLATSGVALTGRQVPDANSQSDTTHDSRRRDDSEFHNGNNPKIMKNWEGWVNPEDLAPMPQCIAQQDQTAWLSAMNRCTRHRCINYIIVCTHFMWLTELSCLSAEFSLSTVEPYMEYCSRSILAKAQLANWIKPITGRNWLVHAGDTNDLQGLSERSLTQGYDFVSVTQKAPTCLKKATSPHHEPFDHVLGSCSFTGTTLHNGNAARPWEYSTTRESISALSFDTAGYDLTDRRISSGIYFDKECFCSHFSVDPQHEPCSDQLELTKARLWLHAMCGSSKLPQDWEKSSKLLGVDYISVSRWARSIDIPNMPQSITSISHHCRTKACDTDLEGFCHVENAIDRTCVCRKVNYSLCEGPCKSFESRKQYVEWLHTLCDGVKDWNGLPDNWRELEALQRGDMIPWTWNLRPANRKVGTCPSYSINMISMTITNVATFLAVYLGERCFRTVTTLEPRPKSPAWVLRGLFLAAILLGGNWANAKFIQSTPGYEDTPILHLLLLWCSLPRLGWLVIAPASIHRSESRDLVTSCSGLYAEALLQIPNMYYMTATFTRGVQQFFHFGIVLDQEIGYYAWFMYGGALLWLVAVALMAVKIIRILRPVSTSHTIVYRVVGDLLTCDSNECRPTTDRGAIGFRFNSERSVSVERPNYGTIPAVAGPSQPPENRREPHLSLYVVLSIALPVIVLAQWLFWIGFIRVSGTE
ncbi:hypothetical protein FCULG_00001908 [Fusarium culmorum]|uniref:Extracellular membrane protein CFEM domain-containing protein n=1 Tax=Fusarium culmorum TaxID=5516 RepID=A0A2T4GQE9_FUSCU|nr:hypothetical protein FCULG_00001908 [Fusarium culmorum]